MKTIFYLILILFLFSSCNSKIESGEWEGEGINFTVSEDGQKITELEILIPYGDEFLAQWYEDLEIKNNTFSSFQDGNSFLGIPERDLKGKFLTNKSAEGTLNDIKWRAEPIK